jgi:SH3-like domain-containing protein
MFDVPSQRGRKMFIAPPGMPVEIVVVSGEWSRVRDLSGELSWVESRALTNQRNLIVEVPQVTVRAMASESGVAVFTASKGVLLELAEPITSSWIKVKHRDGETGYLKASEVWGE